MLSLVKLHIECCLKGILHWINLLSIIYKYKFNSNYIYDNFSWICIFSNSLRIFIHQKQSSNLFFFWMLYHLYKNGLDVTFMHSATVYLYERIYLCVGAWVCKCNMLYYNHITTKKRRPKNKRNEVNSRKRISSQ